MKLKIILIALLTISCSKKYTLYKINHGNSGICCNLKNMYIHKNKFIAIDNIGQCYTGDINTVNKVFFLKFDSMPFNVNINQQITTKNDKSIKDNSIKISFININDNLNYFINDNIIPIKRDTTLFLNKTIINSMFIEFKYEVYPQSSFITRYKTNTFQIKLNDTNFNRVIIDAKKFNYYTNFIDNSTKKLITIDSIKFNSDIFKDTLLTFPHKSKYIKTKKYIKLKM